MAMAWHIAVVMQSSECCHDSFLTRTELGLKVGLLSGDGDGACAHAASLAGIEKRFVRARARPEDKVAFVSDLQVTIEAQDCNVVRKRRPFETRRIDVDTI